jgi:RNA polymerase sigma factor (sigma-70 family)
MEKFDIIEEHYRANHKKMVSRVIGRVPNKSRHLAEEVVQEAYARCMKYFHTFNPERKPFSTWFNYILNNACSDCMKIEGNSGVAPIIYEDEDGDLNPQHLMDDLDIPLGLVVNIQEAMLRQKPERYDVLNMFFNLGMKPREIAECTNFSYGNIRLIISRFKGQFADDNIF